MTYPITATDVVGPVTIVYSTPSGSFFPMSFTGPVTVTATDFYGNTSTATFTVFVHDSTDPAVTTSANLVVEATGPSGAVVTYAPATATDALGATLDQLLEGLRNGLRDRDDDGHGDGVRPRRATHREDVHREGAATRRRR